jgi:tetratricopeptide (TPR) repeat protein
VTAPARAGTPAEAAFAEGQALAASKQFAQAAEKFQAAITADPKYAAAWYGLAAAQRKSGHCDKAIAAYRQYSALAPTEPEPYYGMGLCLRDTGERAAALEALKHYVGMEKRPQSQKWVDHANSVINELSGASAAPAAAAPDKSPEKSTVAGGVKERPPAPAAKPGAATAASAAFTEAQALRDQGRIDDSIAKFKQAIAADPRLMPARAALGELLLKIRRDDEAIDVFKAAVEKNPGYALAWYDLAFALRARGKLPEAVDAYQRYIKLKPADPDPYYGLGRALQHLGRNADARRAYETYVAMEKRPSEKRWVESARAQLQTLAATK